MLQAIIDIGSNTVRMAIYRIDNGQLTMLFKRKHVVGLAAYVKDGVMTQKGIDKTVEVLNEYREFLAGFRITNVTAFTTAALRNAANGREAVEEISRRVNLPVQIISGEDEATYGFIGVTHNLAADAGLIVDIGGASTEIVAFEVGKIGDKISLPFGSLSLREKYCEDILPSGAELIDIRREVSENLRSFAHAFAEEKGRSLCGIGGTFKGAVALANAVFNREGGNRTINLTELNELAERFCRDHALTEDDTVLLLNTVPDRLPTIVTGIAAAAEVMDFLGSTVAVYSDSGVREGYIYGRSNQI